MTLSPSTGTHLAKVTHERNLWAELQTVGASWARDQLLERYDPFARAIASRMFRARLDESISFDDYLQYGRLGLIDAVQRYDCTRGVAFSSFSSARIRGAILNGLARESELAAQNRFWRVQTRDRMDSLKRSCVEDMQLASLDQLATITVGLVIGALLEGDDAEVGGELADSNPANNPYAVNEFDQLVRAARALITKLPEREQLVIGGHYIDQLNFQTLAERLQLSKGRISQLHAQGLQRLRGWLSPASGVDSRL